MTCSSSTTSTPRRCALAATLALAAIVPAAADAGRAERLIAAAQAALARSEGNISNTAKLLGISRPTLYDLLKHYDLQA